MHLNLNLFSSKYIKSTHSSSHNFLPSSSCSFSQSYIASGKDFFFSIGQKTTAAIFFLSVFLFLTNLKLI